MLRGKGNHETALAWDTIGKAWKTGRRGFSPPSLRAASRPAQPTYNSAYTIDRSRGQIPRGNFGELGATCSLPFVGYKGGSGQARATERGKEHFVIREVFFWQGGGGSPERAKHSIATITNWEGVTCDSKLFFDGQAREGRDDLKGRKGGEKEEKKLANGQNKEKMEK